MKVKLYINGELQWMKPGQRWQNLTLEDPITLVQVDQDFYVAEIIKIGKVDRIFHVRFSFIQPLLNYVFIREGQTNEFAAGIGMVFGITSLAVASRSSAKHPFFGYLVGVSAIAFSVWNLSGGMDQTHTYEDTELYDPYSYATTAPAGQTVGWSFSF